MAVYSEYLWLVIVGAFAAFAFGWGTGSNDVANAFGTSVGSKALTLKQAVIIAAIFEFVGALLLGRVSTATIAGGIANISAFQRQPEIYAYGMVCALTIGFAWQALASYLELNVSATHSIIGAIMGFSLVFAGKDGVVWAVHDTSTPGFPYKGVVAIIASWFFAPILTGTTAALIFASCRFLVLRRKNAYQLSFWVLPPLVLATTWINMYFVFTKGAKKLLTSSKDSDWTDAKAVWVSATIAGGLCILTIVIGLPLLRHWVNRKYDSDGVEKVQKGGDVEYAVKDVDDSPVKGLDGPISGQDPADPTGVNSALDDTVKYTWYQKVSKVAFHGVNVDVHKAVETDATVHAIHENAEVFAPRVEYAFSFLQVFSACCVIFAHGAGEVGYMAGPLTTIYRIYEDGMLTKNVKPPIWCIVIGATGLVVGLATYGYNVTRAMGVKLAKLSPTRGFAAELATALVILIAAQYGLPQSSSQCITGAIVGVGLLEGRSGVNWRLFLKIFLAWASTLFVVGLLTAALFSQGVYSPSDIDGKQIIQYENGLVNTTNTVYYDYNATLYAYQAPALANTIPTLSATQWEALNASITTGVKTAKNMINTTVVQTVDAATVLDSLNGALELLQTYAINTLAQPTVFPGADICSAPNATLTACLAPEVVA